MQEEPEYDDSKSTQKQKLERLFKQGWKEVEKLGGWAGAKTGNWLLPLVQNSFRKYFEKADAEYFRKKYPNATDQQIVKKIINLATGNATILGGIVGAAVSIDEIVAIVVALPSGGLTLPAQLGIAGVAIAAEAILLTRIQLRMIANIAKVHGVPLDPNDPEDALLVLWLSLGGSAAESLGGAAAKAGGKMAEKVIRKQISGETLKAMQKLAAKTGQKILQRSIVKYAVPGVSIAVGSLWNFVTTKAAGQIANKYFTDRKNGVDSNNALKKEGSVKSFFNNIKSRLPFKAEAKKVVKKAVEKKAPAKKKVKKASAKKVLKKALPKKK